VTIRVSKGEQPIVVPNLVGMTRDAAMAKLNALGLLPNVYAEGIGPDYTGKVTKQDPKPGKEILPSAPDSEKKVNIWVNEATEPPTTP
jgi:beta-lactam-binding protein with PASTA domain